MRTYVRPVLAAVLVLSALASATRAGEPADPTVKVVLRDRWKAGDVATLSSNEKRVKSIVKFIGKEPSPNADDSFKESRVVDQEVIIKCLEADADGHSTKRLLYFVKYAYATTGEAGPEKDASLEKVFVGVDGVGPARTLTVLSPDAKPSPRAMRWLEGAHGKGEMLDALYAALEPKEPIAVGATSKPTGEAIAAALGSDDAPIDAETSSADVTLASVDGEKADLHLVVVAQSKGRLIGKALVSWSSGGASRFDLQLTRALAADAFDTTGESEDEFEGATAEKGGETRVSIKSRAEWVLAKGGSMPEIPKPGAPKSEVPVPEVPQPAAPQPAAPQPAAPTPGAPKPGK